MHLPDTWMKPQRLYGDMFCFFLLLLAATVVHLMEFFLAINLQNSCGGLDNASRA